MVNRKTKSRRDGEKKKCLLGKKYINKLAKNADLETKNEYIDNFCEVIKKRYKAVDTLDKIKNEFRYKPSLKLFKPSLHIGQRKLFLSELQFLTNTLKRYDVSGYVIYVGAAPSNHLYRLFTYFPNLKWILIDPSRFNIFLPDNSYKKYIKYLKFINSTTINFIQKSNKKIFIVNDIFTDSMATYFTSFDTKTYLISDIRTNIDVNHPPGDIDLLWNLAQQFIWYKIINPKAALFKFRFPFFDKKDIEIFSRFYKKEPYKSTFKKAKKLGINFIKDYKNKKLNYLDGKIYIQAWPGISSTESRLYIKKEDIKVYELKNYEDKFFYYNNFLRVFGIHLHDYVDSKNGIDYCGDCALEIYIWEQYKNKFRRKISIKAEMNSLSKLLKKSLRRDSHGFLLDYLNDNILDKMIKNRKIYP
jgi:hypothetical protein